MPAGGALRTDWYDEADPTQTFATSATAAIAARLGFRSVEHADMGLPFLFLEAIELSPPGWRRESSAPPPLGSFLPTDSDLLSPDRIAAARYAMIIADSMVDLDEQNHAMHLDDDEDLEAQWGPVEDPNLDWDRVLMDGLATLGVEPVGMPDWLWAHVRWSHAT